MNNKLTKKIVLSTLSFTGKNEDFSFVFLFYFRSDPDPDQNEVDPQH